MDFYKQFPNSSINFNENSQLLLQKLIENEISTIDLLTTPPIELATTHDLDIKQLLYLIHTIKKEQSNLQHKNIDETRQRFFTTGDEGLDQLLNGGIHLQQITEIFGSSSTGKSQFIMQLTKTVQKPLDQGGLNGKAVLISTEGFVETKRLVEINETHKLDKIFLINCMDLETQNHILSVQLPTLLKNDPSIKLVIIDSVSHHIRVEVANDFENYKRFVLNLGMNLLNLTLEYDIALVVTNQISDKPIQTILNSDLDKLNYNYQIGWLNGWNQDDIHKRQNNLESKNYRINSMGLNWDSIIDVKLLFEKNYKPMNREIKRSSKEEVIIDNEGFWKLQRLIKLIYSNKAPSNSIKFKIQPNGLTTNF